MNKKSGVKLWIGKIVDSDYVRINFFFYNVDYGLFRTMNSLDDTFISLVQN